MRNLVSTPSPAHASGVRGGSRLLVAAFALALVACGGGGGSGGGSVVPPLTPPPPPTQEELDLAQDVLDLVNDERTSRGLDPLDGHVDVAEAAYGHAFDMDDRDFFSHTNPGGENPDDRLRRAGVFFNGWGENIARGQATPAEVMADWMASDGHRANILTPSFQRLGVGVRVGSGGPWWVQNFVSP